MRKKRRLKERFKYIAAISGAVIGGALAIKAVDSLFDTYLWGPENFDLAEWIEIYNPDGNIWDDYMKANIPHNTWNWNLYEEMVTKENEGKLVGKILIPKFEE